jgi:hypothetical protein
MEPMERDPGKEEMIGLIVTEMSNRGPMIDVPLAESIADALIEKAGGTDHLVIADGKHWTMKHPLTERFHDDLFECPMTERAAQLAAQGAFDTGAHRLYVGEYGIVMWEEVHA